MMPSATILMSLLHLSQRFRLTGGFSVSGVVNGLPLTSGTMIMADVDTFLVAGPTDWVLASFLTGPELVFTPTVFMGLAGVDFLDAAGDDPAAGDPDVFRVENGEEAGKAPMDLLKLLRRSRTTRSGSGSIGGKRSTTRGDSVSL